MRAKILVYLLATNIFGIATCNHAVHPPGSLRNIATPPSASVALGTAILDAPTDNVLNFHRIDGTTVRLEATAFVPTPDPWVVPHIGPLKWPAVFAVEDKRLWVWADGSWGWLDRDGGRGTAGFVTYNPAMKAGPAQLTP